MFAAFFFGIPFNKQNATLRGQGPATAGDFRQAEPATTGRPIERGLDVENWSSKTVFFSPRNNIFWINNDCNLRFMWKKKSGFGNSHKLYSASGLVSANLETAKDRAREAEDLAEETLNQAL